ncbi:MAG: hypothetical protein AAB619_03245 [Patescibacteria group bacterium]
MISTRVTPWTPKLAAFLVPSVIGGAAFWFFVQQALRGHVVFNNVALVNIGLYFLLGMFCLAVWLGPLLLVPYVGAWRSVRLTAVFVAVLPVLVFFPFQLWTWMAAALLLGFMSWGMESIADDMHNRLSVQPMLSLPRGITFIMFSVIIAISLLYYQQLRGSNSTAAELSTRLIDQTVTLTERALPTFYKDYRVGMTVDELIGAQIPTADSILKGIKFDAFTDQTQQQQALQQKLQDLGLDPNTLNINVKQGEAQVRQQIDAKLQEFRTQTIDQARQELAKRLDIPLAGTDTIHDALIRVVGKQFDAYVRRYVTFVPVLLALALFFILRFFTSFLQAVVVWFGWVFLKLYRAFKLVQITHQTVPAEKVEWGF